MFPCDGNIGFIQISLPHDNQISVTMYVEEDGSKLRDLTHILYELSIRKLMEVVNATFHAGGALLFAKFSGP